MKNFKNVVDKEKEICYIYLNYNGLSLKKSLSKRLFFYLGDMSMENREFNNKTILKIKKEIESFLKDYNFILVDIEIRNDKKTPILTIYVYNSEDMSVNRLAFLNKKMSSGLLSSLNEEFIIEISSPGINRVLKHIEEFDIFKDKEMRILTNEDQYIVGICKGIFPDNKLLILSETKEIFIDIKNIKKAKLCG